MNKPAYREEFESLDELVGAVVRATTFKDVGQRDRRLTMEAVATGNSEFSGAEGGYVVPDEFAAELWTRVLATGSILARCARQPLTRGNTLNIPAVSEASRADGGRFGGARMFWADEAAPATASRPEFGFLRLHLKKLLGLVFTTDEIVDDGPALAAVLKRMFGLEAAFTIEDAIVDGDGIAKPLGVLRSPALITVAPEAGQAAGTVVAENIAKNGSPALGPIAPLGGMADQQ